MVFTIVIAGQSQCQVFGQICLIADHLAQNLPDFTYVKIEKSVLEWEQWLYKINVKHKWHHLKSPIIWKELLIKGSKPYYIGGASQFLDYCYSYYNFDSFLGTEKFKGLLRNFSQYRNKVKQETETINKAKDMCNFFEQSSKCEYIVTISGSGLPLAMFIISGLLEMSLGRKRISKIYIYDDNYTQAFLDFVERECNYIFSNNPGKVVKLVEKIGIALTHTDLLIVLNHVPFQDDFSIGDWLHSNKKIMENLALSINASAYRKMYILFPNLGPACYNATILMNSVTNIRKENIVVATSDLGLELAVAAAEIAKVPLRNMFCSPVWGFVGVNHLVDIRTTFHKYNSLEPYNRYTKVKNSTLKIGTLTPEMRTMEYLLYFDESLWSNLLERKNKMVKGNMYKSKSIAVLNVVKLWLLDVSSDYVINLGIKCNGSFGLDFNGIFSQPSRFVDGKWVPANDFLLPRDSQVKISYLQEMANYTIHLKKGDLPKIIPQSQCCSEVKYLKKKKKQ